MPVDPVVRAFLDRVEAEGGPPLETLSPVEARAAAASALARDGGVPEAVASIENTTAGGVPVRIYRPSTDADLPAVVYFHGGGWVVCDVDTHDVVCRALSRRAGAMVVSVNYRLAPEHKFPAAVEDSYRATAWVAAHAPDLGIDVGRLCVAGDSAGGNLATVVALRSRDQNGPPIALQALVYPVTNLSSFDTASYSDFADGYYLTRAEMEWFRGHYLAGPEDALHPHASPLLAADLSGLPPALIITAECDPLRDEGAAYARRLEAAGVPVTYTCYAGMIHPFFSLLGVIPQGTDAIGQIADAVGATASRTE